MVAVTDLRGLTVMAKTELIVDKVIANIFPINDSQNWAICTLF